MKLHYLAPLLLLAPLGIEAQDVTFRAEGGTIIGITPSQAPGSIPFNLGDPASLEYTFDAGAASTGGGTYFAEYPQPSHYRLMLGAATQDWGGPTTPDAIRLTDDQLSPAGCGDSYVVGRSNASPFPPLFGSVTTENLDLSAEVFLPNVFQPPCSNLLTTTALSNTPPDVGPAAGNRFVSVTLRNASKVPFTVAFTFETLSLAPDFVEPQDVTFRAAGGTITSILPAPAPGSFPFGVGDSASLEYTFNTGAASTGGGTSSINYPQPFHYRVTLGSVTQAWGGTTTTESIELRNNWSLFGLCVDYYIVGRSNASPLPFLFGAARTERFSLDVGEVVNDPQCPDLLTSMALSDTPPNLSLNTSNNANVYVRDASNNLVTVRFDFTSLTVVPIAPPQDVTFRAAGATITSITPAPAPGSFPFDLGDSASLEYTFDAAAANIGGGISFTDYPQPSHYQLTLGSVTQDWDGPTATDSISLENDFILFGNCFDSYVAGRSNASPLPALFGSVRTESIELLATAIGAPPCSSLLTSEELSNTPPDISLATFSQATVRLRDASEDLITVRFDFTSLTRVSTAPLHAAPAQAVTGSTIDLTGTGEPGHVYVIAVSSGSGPTPFLPGLPLDLSADYTSNFAGVGLFDVNGDTAVHSVFAPSALIGLTGHSQMVTFGLPLSYAQKSPGIATNFVGP